MAEEKEIKSKILVVDDNVANVELLEAYLISSGYDVVKAYDGQEGLDAAFSELPDLILLDIMMPKLDGYEVCRKVKGDDKTQFIPVVMITALSELEAKIKGLDFGADDFLSKPFNRLELLARVRSLLRIKRLHDDLDTSESIIITLAMALEAKDPYTRGHSERVASYAMDLASSLDLSGPMRQLIHKAGLLHDIGKIGVKEAILNKNSGLEISEYEEVINHPSLGANICEPLRSLADIVPMVRYHHERFDGKGHPEGLTGEDIPLGARLISIADAFDAMTSVRPYRDAMTQEVALQIMESESDTGQWDPELLVVFIEMMKNSGKG